MTFISDKGYRSLVDPPAGYALRSVEVLRRHPDGVSDKDRELYRACGVPDDAVDAFEETNDCVFRGVICYPDGDERHFSVVLSSLVPLGKIEFWTEFWGQALKSRKRRPKHGHTGM